MKFLRTPSNILAAILVLFIAIAPVRGMFIAPSEDSVAHVAGEHRVEGTVLDINPGESTVGLTLTDIVVDGVTKDDRVLVRAPRFPSLTLGDRVNTNCFLERPEPIEGFAYDTYLAIRDVYAVCRVQESPYVTGQGAPSIRLALAKVRAMSIAQIGSMLPEPQSTLLVGLLLGRADFTDEWKDRLLATGTTHVVAASGFNVSLVTLTLFAALTWCGVRRQRAYWLLLVGIAVYAMLAGAESAVVRAGVMGALVLTAGQIGRKTSMRNTVLLAVALMLAVEPRLLLHDAGFQLSILSTVALIWLSPFVASRLTWVPEALELRDILASTLAATLATLPIVVLSFGQVSLISPVVNLFVLPLVPFAMSVGIIGVILGLFYAPIGPYVMLPAWALLTAILWIIRMLSSLPFAAVPVHDSVRYVLVVFFLIVIGSVCRLAAKKV